MALNLGKLFFQLGADTSGLNKAEAEAKKFVANVKNSFQSLEQAVGGYIGLQTAKAVLKDAEAFKMLQQRIKTATSATGDYNTVSRQLFNISNQTGTALESNVSLFQNLARVAPTVGSSNQEILKLLTSLNQLGQIGGSSADDIKFSMRQFGQAMASGTVRAEEFNSIVENTPEIAARIAKGMNMTTGELRLMVLQGKVLSKDVFESLLKQSGDINEEFGKIPMTMGRAWEKMSNNFQQWLGDVDRASDGTSRLANVINSVAEGFQFAMAYVGLSLTEGVATIQDAYSKLWIDIQIFWENVKKAGQDAADALEMAFAASADAVKKFFGGALESIAEGASSIPLVGDKFAGLKQAGADLSASADATEKLVEKIAAQNAEHDKTISLLQQEKKNLEENRTVERTKAQEALAYLTTRNSEEEAGAKERDAIQKAENEKYAAALKAKQEAEKAHQLAMKELKKLSSDFKSLENSTGGGLDELQLEEKKYADKQELINRAEAAGLESQIGFQQMRENLAIEHAEKLRLIEENKYKAMGTIQKIAYMAGNDLTKRADGAALQAAGIGFEKQIDQAAQYSKTFFNIKKAMALAMALIDAPAAILSSFRFGSEIGGPIVGGIFAAISAAATAVQVGAIASSSFNGGKAVGGDVFAGGKYRINENGPEVLSSGGKDYLMMGSQGGTITPNNKLGASSGGGKVVVNVMNIEGQTAKVTSRETDQGQEVNIIIETVEKRIAGGIIKGGSEVSNAMERQYGLNRSARGQ